MKILKSKYETAVSTYHFNRRGLKAYPSQLKMAQLFFQVQKTAETDVKHFVTCLLQLLKHWCLNHRLCNFWAEILMKFELT